MQSERWANIGREILFSARSELYMNLPFLDGALAALPVQDGFETSSLATDAKALYFSGAWLAQRFERSRTSVNRAYLTAISGRSRAILQSKACSTVWITAASRRTRPRCGGAAFTARCTSICLC